MAVSEFAEGPLLRHLLRRLHKARPGHPRQRAADADAAHAKRGDIRKRACGADQEIDGPWMHRFHDRRNFLRRRDARRIEAVGAGFGISGQPVDHEIHILYAAQERFAAAGEQDAGLVGVDRLARSLDALDRKRAIEQRLCIVACIILDRETGDAGLHGAADVDAYFLRLMRKAVLEVGIDGNIDGRADRGEMIADIINGNAVVCLSDAPGKACTRGSQRLEAEMLQRLGAADVKGIRDDEAAGLVELLEGGALVSSCQHDFSPSCSVCAGYIVTTLWFCQPLYATTSRRKVRSSARMNLFSSAKSKFAEPSLSARKRAR